MVVLDRQLQRLAIEKVYTVTSASAHIKSRWLGRNRLLIASVLIGFSFVIGPLI